MTTADLTSLRTLPHAAADLIRPRGKWAQGAEITNTGAMCLTGALIRACTVPGDGYIAREVYRHWDRAETWNDAANRKKAEVLRELEREITEADLAETFGPQWEPIVALVRRAAVLTDDEVRRLDAAWVAARDAAWVAARDAVRDAARDAAWVAARDAVRDAAWVAARDAAWDAARALVVRDLIGQHGFTQAHYDLLTGPWASVIGPVHPDDVTA